MGIYRIIRRQFAYLEKSYGFVNVLNQRHGSYYYAVWSNYQKNIMVLYNELDDEPVSIRIYDAGSFSFYAEEYKQEFEQKIGKPPTRWMHPTCNSYARLKAMSASC